jgi:hypothetical protein
MITALIDLMGIYYQAGNLPQMAAIARSLLASIPNDIVALQFLGLALFQMGRVEAARQIFAKVAGAKGGMPIAKWLTTGELATATVYREAISPASGLGDAWQHIAQTLYRFGFPQAAKQASHAAQLAKGLKPAVIAEG